MRTETPTPAAGLRLLQESELPEGRRPAHIVVYVRGGHMLQGQLISADEVEGDVIELVHELLLGGRPTKLRAVIEPAEVAAYSYTAST